MTSTTATTARPAATSAAGPGPRVDRPAPQRRRRGGSHSSGWWPLLFVGPFFAGVAVFNLFPILQTAYFSFTEWGPFGGATFTGFDNWAKLLSDPALPAAFVNTGIYIGVILLAIPVAVWIAALLARPGLRGVTTYRTMFFVPYLAMPVAVAIVWRLMFNGDFGIINGALSVIGIDGPRWLTTPGLAIVAVSIVGAWMALGFNIIILSAGLRAIPPELYEAASIDGASRRIQFWRITVPLLTPSIFFLTVMNIIGGFQLFDLLYAILGPSNPVIEQTKSIVFLFYSASFVDNDRGYGAVIALVILVVVALVTLLQFRLQRRWVNYV
jgi:multiple sugar transport system permease protein